MQTFAVHATTADAVNQEVSVLRAAVGWWHGQGRIHADPTVGLQQRPAPPDWTPCAQLGPIAALSQLDAGLRDKTDWRLL